MHNSPLILEAANRVGIGLNRGHLELVHGYLELLCRWGQKINLISRPEVEFIVQRHLVDAFQMVSLFSDPCDSYVDVGSGGGIPGIPFVIINGPVRSVLVEKNGKKCTFLRTAVHQLNLGDVEVRNCRASELEGEAFSVASSRATWEPTRWLGRGLKTIGPNGAVVLFVAQIDDAPGEVEGLTEIKRKSYQLLDGTPRVMVAYKRL